MYIIIPLKEKLMFSNSLVNVYNIIYLYPTFISMHFEIDMYDQDFANVYFYFYYYYY